MSQKAQILIPRSTAWHDIAELGTERSCGGTSSVGRPVRPFSGSGPDPAIYPSVRRLSMQGWCDMPYCAKIFGLLRGQRITALSISNFICILRALRVSMTLAWSL